MSSTRKDENFQERRRLEALGRDALLSHQLSAVNKLLETILPANTFYKEKLSRIQRPIDSLDEFRKLPVTTKAELQTNNKELGFAANRTYPLDRYSRFHRTSGTHGRPMICLLYTSDAADE